MVGRPALDAPISRLGVVLSQPERHHSVDRVAAMDFHVHAGQAGALLMAGAAGVSPSSTIVELQRKAASYTPIFTCSASVRKWLLQA